NVHFLRDAEGAVVRMIGSIVDVSEKRRDESRLRLLQRAIDASDNGVVVAAVEGSRLPVVYVNGAFERMGGVLREDIEGRDLVRAQANAPAALGAMADAIAEGNDGHALVSGAREGIP